MENKNDIKGKKIFKSFVESRGKAKNIKFTTDDKDRIDAIVDNSTVELKYRKKYNYYSPFIQNVGIMVEREKVDYGIKTIEESGYTNSYYCSIFNDNVITFVDFQKIKNNLKPIKKELPISTDFDIPNKRYKEIYFVPVSFLKVYKIK